MSLKIVSIEGNIGSGKSTLVRLLQKADNTNLVYAMDYLEEPVNEWETIRDEESNIIEKFYKDQKKYAFSFQMMAYISRLVSIKRAVERNQGKDCIIICERSVWTDRFVFAKMLYDEGNIEEVNFQIYLRWFDEFIKDYPLSGIIYVTTPPDICEQRIKSRNRAGETIPLEYLVRCHDYHIDWLLGTKKDMLRIMPDFNDDIKEDIYAFFVKLFPN